jgi:hypothetical protein
MQPVGHAGPAARESAPARQRPAPSAPEHVEATIPFASGPVLLTPSAVLRLQRVVGNGSVRRLLPARGPGAVVQREFEAGWTVRPSSALAPSDQTGYELYLFPGTPLEIDLSKTRMEKNKVQVRAKGEELGLGWVNLKDVQDPHEAAAASEAKTIGEESTRSAQQAMAETVEQQVTKMISDQQKVRVQTQTGLPSGVAPDDVGTVVGRVVKLALVAQAEEWPTLQVRMDKCLDPTLEGQVIEIKLNAVLTEADMREESEEKERREAHRVILDDEQVENAVVGKELAAYAANKGINLQGKIHYLEEPAFEQAFIDSELRERPDENNEQVTANATLLYVKIEPTGFREGEEIYVRADRRGFGTEIHEAIHRYSSRNVLENIGFNFNEGLTEYFTRIVTRDWIERGDEYYFQLDMINDLVDKLILSPDDLADMYFKGAADLLVKRMNDKLGPAFRYSAYMALVNESKIPDAMTYLSEKLRTGKQPTQLNAPELKETQQVDKPKEEKGFTMDDLDDLLPSW